MKRMGRTHRPFYRICVIDQRKARDAEPIEEIGTYNPKVKGNNYTLNLDRAQYWVGVGAQPSETVASFIKKSAKMAAVAA